LALLFKNFVIFVFIYQLFYKKECHGAACQRTGLWASNSGQAENIENIDAHFLLSQLLRPTPIFRRQHCKLDETAPGHVSSAVGLAEALGQRPCAIQVQG
jgi:hypothetical protein